MEMSELNEVRKKLDGIVKETMTKAYKALDERILASLVGSHILDIRVTPIPHRKRMVLVTIKTDAKPVIGSQKNSFVCPEEIILRVRV